MDVTLFIAANHEVRIFLLVANGGANAGYGEPDVKQLRDLEVILADPSHGAECASHAPDEGEVVLVVMAVDVSNPHSSPELSDAIVLLVKHSDDSVEVSDQAVIVVFGEGGTAARDGEG